MTRMLFAWLCALIMGAASAQSSAAQTRAGAYNVQMVKIAFQHWLALPIFIDRGADIGTLYLLSTLASEQFEARGYECYKELEVEAPRSSGDILVVARVSHEAAGHLGLPLRQFLAKLSLSGERMEVSNAALSLTDILVWGPNRPRQLTDPSNLHPGPACAAHRGYLRAGNAEDILVWRVIEAAHRFGWTLERATAAAVKGEIAKGQSVLGSAKARIAEGSEDVLLVSAPRNVIAVQPNRLNGRRLLELYAYYTENPESYVELQSIVDTYLRGGEAGLLRELADRIRRWREENGYGGDRLEDFVASIFTSEGSDFRPDVEEELGGLDPELRSAAAYTAALLAIPVSDLQ